jgi:hypothetical protein
MDVHRAAHVRRRTNVRPRAVIAPLRPPGSAAAVRWDHCRCYSTAPLWSPQVVAQYIFAPLVAFVRAARAADAQWCALQARRPPPGWPAGAFVAAAAYNYAAAQHSAARRGSVIGGEASAARGAEDEADRVRPYVCVCV